MRGGILLAQGADTCVYDPIVECADKTKIPAGDYVSRLVLDKDAEVFNQKQVKEAIKRIQKKYPDKDIASYFNVAVAQCKPKLKESDLKSSTGRYCSASQRRIDDVAKGENYVNLITPRQEGDMHKQPIPFVQAKLPALLHAVAYLNNENVVHGDAHAGNIAKMGDRLVLHDWGRAFVGLERFQNEMKYILEDGDTLDALRRYGQWKFPCDLMDTCLLPTSDEATFHRFMNMYDSVSIIGSAYSLGFLPGERAKEALGIASKLLVSKIHPSQVMPLVHDMIDNAFSDGNLPLSLVPYSEAIPGSLEYSPDLYSASESTPTPPPPKMKLALPPAALKGGRKRLTAETFCTCIKSVKKTLKQRPGITKEKGAIAVCVSSMLHRRRKTIKNFKCGRKPRLVTQKKLRA